MNAEKRLGTIETGSDMSHSASRFACLCRIWNGNVEPKSVIHGLLKGWLALGSIRSIGKCWVVASSAWSICVIRMPIRLALIIGAALTDDNLTFRAQRHWLEWRTQD